MTFDTSCNGESPFADPARGKDASPRFGAQRHSRTQDTDASSRSAVAMLIQSDEIETVLHVWAGLQGT